MNNYHYLISSLPSLTLSWGKDSASPSDMRKEIYENCGRHDRRLFKWLEYAFDDSSYRARVYQGYGHGDYDALLKLGPNIKDWPEIAPLGDSLLLRVCFDDLSGLEKLREDLKASILWMDWAVI